MRLAWADPDLRQRLMFILMVFGVFALGIHVQVPIPGISSATLMEQLKDNMMFQMVNMFGGGALRKISIFSLGLNPYITSSIIMQIMYTAFPNLKKELQEGGEYARKNQNRRTRILTLFLSVLQGWGVLQMMSAGSPQIHNLPLSFKLITVLFWMAGSMFMLWLGEQISERGIGNGVSLMIFAGIVLSLPVQGQMLLKGVQDGQIPIWGVFLVVAIFVAMTWLIVYFTTAQRRIPIQHMRRQVGTKQMGGQTSYLPLSVNMVGVMPIIFAISLIYLPAQFSSFFGGKATPMGNFLDNVGSWLNPGAPNLLHAFVGAILYTALIFFFTYFWTAIQYNVSDIADNLKRHGSFIPGVRPGKQTKDFLDGVISRVTIVGAGFIAIVALVQFVAPRIAQINMNTSNVLGGTSLLIMVSVALETLRQIEANLLMKQYGQ